MSDTSEYVGAPVVILTSVSKKRFALGEAGVWKLAETAQDVLYRYRVAPSYCYEYLSPSVFAMTGHTAEEFYANADLPMQCVHPDDVHLLIRNHQGPVEDIPVSVLLRWIHPDGRIVWSEHRRMLILDAERRLIAVEGIARDARSLVGVVA